MESLHRCKGLVFQRLEGWSLSVLLSQANTNLRVREQQVLVIISNERFLSAKSLGFINPLFSSFSLCFVIFPSLFSVPVLCIFFHDLRFASFTASLKPASLPLSALSALQILLTYNILYSIRYKIINFYTLYNRVYNNYVYIYMNSR